MLLARPDSGLQARLLGGLADRSRLRILDALRGGELRVADVVAATGLSQPNVSKHLRCLRGCGLVEGERRGREVYYAPVAGLDELLEAVDLLLARVGEDVDACELTDRTLTA